MLVDRSADFMYDVPVIQYRQTKFLGEWREPAEGVTLSGACFQVGTKNGCGSGESQKGVPKVQGLTAESLR